MKIELKSLPLPKVANFLSVQINSFGRKQKDIAAAIGYEKPNIITMFKQGLTKLPIEKVGPMAKALGVDPVYLLRITLNDYMPKTYEAVVQIFGQEPITQSEQDILAAIRELSGDGDLEMKSRESKAKLAEFVKTLS